MDFAKMQSRHRVQCLIWCGRLNCQRLLGHFRFFARDERLLAFHVDDGVFVHLYTSLRYSLSAIGADRSGMPSEVFELSWTKLYHYLHTQTISLFLLYDNQPPRSGVDGLSKPANWRRSCTVNAAIHAKIVMYQRNENLVKGKIQGALRTWQGHTLPTLKNARGFLGTLNPVGYVSDMPSLPWLWWRSMSLTWIKGLITFPNSFQALHYG